MENYMLPLIFYPLYWLGYYLFAPFGGIIFSLSFGPFSFGSFPYAYFAVSILTLTGPFIVLFFVALLHGVTWINSIRHQSGGRSFKKVAGKSGLELIMTPMMSFWLAADIAVVLTLILAIGLSAVIGINLNCSDPYYGACAAIKLDWNLAGAGFLYVFLLTGTAVAHFMILRKTKKDILASLSV